MKVKRTLHEIYAKLTELREIRDIKGRLVAECLVEEDQKAAEEFTKKYKHFDDLINYLSEIEVEYEYKYETEVEDE